jgi:enamine deaminase RidA (YjgF/YER057c/UK114 family)
MQESREPVLFPAAVVIGRSVYVGCQCVDSGDAIGEQTGKAFERLVALLEAAGASMADLVNLRTYYVYRGPDGPGVTRYWNEMTAVRLRYLHDPGPAATALRVHGVPGQHQLIGVDGIASLEADRQRLMPAHAWDWTIPTPFSQGWRIGDRVFVGGQIAADRQGKALAIGDVAAQTAITLDYIRHVLLDAGQNWSQVAAMRIGYKHGPAQGGDHLADILSAMRAVLPEPRPAVTAFGVDLLYEGLLLEIDAVACSAGKVQFGASDAATGSGGLDGFPAATRSSNELHIGGLSARADGSLEAQVEGTFDLLGDLIRESGVGWDMLVKLTLFYVAATDGDASAAERDLILDIARRRTPLPGPVVTLISVASLPHRGSRFQLDGVAVLSAEGRVALALPAAQPQ